MTDGAGMWIAVALLARTKDMGCLALILGFCALWRCN